MAEHLTEPQAPLNEEQNRQDNAQESRPPQLQSLHLQEAPTEEVNTSLRSPQSSTERQPQTKCNVPYWFEHLNYTSDHDTVHMSDYLVLVSLQDSFSHERKQTAVTQTLNKRFCSKQRANKGVFFGSPSPYMSPESLQ
ncbi:hypothetical protein ABVT39_025731 [Epinephelus coioides]